jgi:hypothetical protein
VGNPLIGEVAMWTAIKAFVVAASGLDAATVYRAQQNAPGLVGTSVRLWSDEGCVPLAINWQGQRVKLAERWAVEVLAAEVGGVYAGEALGVAFGHVGLLADTLASVRDALLQGLPAGVTGAASGVAGLTIEADVPGVPLQLSVGPAELLTATRTRKTAEDLRWSPAEIIVQVEVVVDRPRNTPGDLPAAVEVLGGILGKLHRDMGPVDALRIAGLAFRRYAMAARNLTALDRSVIRSRARADLVLSVDVGDTMQIDRVAACGAPTGEVTI